MIKTFTELRGCMFFPRRWANSVANWLTEIVSPNGTLDITNTVNPTEGNGPKIDVNPKKTYEAMRDAISNDFLLKDNFRNALADSVDGTSIVHDGHAICVNPSFLSDQINQYMQSPAAGGGQGGGQGGGTYCCRVAVSDGKPTAFYFGDDLNLSGSIAEVEARTNVVKIETFDADSLFDSVQS